MGMKTRLFFTKSSRQGNVEVLSLRSLINMGIAAPQTTLLKMSSYNISKISSLENTKNSGLLTTLIGNPLTNPNNRFFVTPSHKKRYIMPCFLLAIIKLPDQASLWNFLKSHGKHSSLIYWKCYKTFFKIVSQTTMLMTLILHWLPRRRNVLKLLTIDRSTSQHPFIRSLPRHLWRGSNKHFHHPYPKTNWLLWKTNRLSMLSLWQMRPLTSGE